MKLKKSSRDLVDAAMSEIETLELEKVEELNAKGEILLVDVRDPRELKKEGKIENALHCPRGLIEFWVDPESPYFRKEFETDKKLVLFCAMGWRSALTVKTLQDMGVENIAHIEGGFTAWKNAGKPVVLGIE